MRKLFLFLFFYLVGCQSSFCSYARPFNKDELAELNAKYADMQAAQDKKFNEELLKLKRSSLKPKKVSRFNLEKNEKRYLLLCKQAYFLLPIESLAVFKEISNIEALSIGSFDSSRFKGFGEYVLEKYKENDQAAFVQFVLREFDRLGIQRGSK